MKIENDVKLDFDNVLIKPKRSNLKSRKEVILDRDFNFLNSGTTLNCVPIMASNMDTTGVISIADLFESNKMITCLHKHYDIEALYSYFLFPREYTAYSMGITEQDVSKWKIVKSKLPTGNIKIVCIDVANGYTKRFVDFVAKFRDDNPETIIIAGNVVTPEQTMDLLLHGADVVKVGIGSGSVCTTRLQTGVGYPQLSAILECSDVARGLNGHIISDGGCKYPGDIAKAFGAGADFVMLGGMIAGYEESGGETIIKDGDMFKGFHGMSSKKANETYNGGLDDYKAAEGKEVLIPFRGKLSEELQTIYGGLRSACTYVGARNLKEMAKRTTFIRVSSTHNKIFE